MVPHRIYIHNEEDEATDSEGHGKTLRYRPSHNYSHSYRITGSGTFVGHGFQIGEFGVKSIPEHLISEAPSGLKHAKNETVILSTIGRGSSGYVSLGLHVPTLTTVAIKHFNVGMADRRQDMIRELNALYTINKNNRLSAKNVCHFKPVLSQYIVQLYDAYTDSEHRVCMLLEYMACGSLQKWIDQEGMMNETDCAVVAHSVVQALCVIHSRGIIHRDIKPANILCSGNGTVKLGDFGIAALTQYVGSSNTTINSQTYGGLLCLNKFCTEHLIGTLCFMSPECLAGLPPSPQCDIWALGITLITLLLGRPPYQSCNSYWSLVDSIGSGIGDIASILPRCSEDCCDFIRLCLENDPKERPSASQLLIHPFLAISPLVIHIPSALSSLSQDEFNLQNLSNNINDWWSGLSAEDYADVLCRYSEFVCHTTDHMEEKSNLQRHTFWNSRNRCTSDDLHTDLSHPVRKVQYSEVCVASLAEELRVDINSLKWFMN